MNKVQIVNFLLTRRCNLNCPYCAIARDSDEYGSLKYFSDNEITTSRVLSFLKRVKLHNPNVFILWYGGEPLLRSDLPEIIQFCHDLDINYSIITNNTGIIQERLTDLIDSVGYLQGLTTSVDPSVLSYDSTGDHSVKKSIKGIEGLIKHKDRVKDLVAEITVTNETIDYLIPLVKMLSAYEINSDITFIDIAKNSYYDFSNIGDPNVLVRPDEKVIDIITHLVNSDYDIHMKDTILKKILDILPSNQLCRQDEEFHNLTIDADGKVRLCLRIRGHKTLELNDQTIFDDTGNLNESINNLVSEDMFEMCEGCNWPCILFSEFTLHNSDKVDDLLHTNKR